MGKRKELTFTDTNLNKRDPKNVRGCFKNANVCFPHRNTVIAFCFRECVKSQCSAASEWRHKSCTSSSVSERFKQSFYVFAFFKRYTFSTHDARWMLVFMYGFIHVGVRGSILSMGKRIFFTSKCPGQH